MRFLKGSVILSAFVALLINSNLLVAAPERTIAGRLIFESAELQCQQQCVVTLLAYGVRPVQSVFADLGGRFTFENVPRGTYSIRVDIDGFESVNQPIQEFEESVGLNIIVPLTRKPTISPHSSNSPNSSNGADVINVSEFLSRYPKKAVSFFEKGSESLKNKKNDEAVKYLRNAVELAPTFYQAHNQLGIAYRETGRLDDAEQEFATAHRLNATAVEPLLNLTRLYLDQNAPDRAVTTGEQAIKVDSHSAPGFFLLGVALYRTGQFDRAEVVLKRTLDLAPKMGDVRLMLANVYLKLQQYDNTLEQLNRYIVENPKGQQLEDAREMRDKLMAARQAQ